MRQYLDLLQRILDEGVDKGDRTGTGTRSLFGHQLEVDLERDGFPLLTTKKMFWRGLAEELFWMLRGETNIRSLQDRDVHIWDEWASSDGELGPVYGAQWRCWKTPDGRTIDQIAEVEQRIRDKPDDRRLIVTAWNPGDVERQSLPPCHCFFQFNVAGGRLHCHMFQRSADVFLGVPFNIASYSLLTMMMARVTGLRPGRFIHSFGDVHIYNNHFDQVHEQLRRKPLPLPRMEILRTPKHVWEFKFDDFRLIGYKHHPAIKGEVAV